MRHPKFIVFLRELQGDPQGWWRSEAKKLDKYDGVAYRLRERLDREREASLPAYWVVYLEVIFLVVFVVGLVWFLINHAAGGQG